MKWLGWEQGILQHWRIWLIAPGLTAIAIAGSLTGWFQPLEWALLDQFFRFRPIESLDDRIVIVTIDDHDITQAGQWPVSDDVLAQLLLKLKAQQPRVVGLDLYRDLPVATGYDRLTTVFRSMPNLIGVQKRFGDRRVPPPPALDPQQVAAADLVVDADGTVRRALLSGIDEQTQDLCLGLGAKVALAYLNTDNIHLETVNASQMIYQLGQATILPFQSSDGGYVNADAQGYQTLLNFRGNQLQFRSVAMTDVLQGNVPTSYFQDRIVLIGSTAESTKDFFPTPYDNRRQDRSGGMPGVVVQANITSQILSAALDGRPFIRVLPDRWEWLWVFGWSVAGLLVTWKAMKLSAIGTQGLYGRAIFRVGLLSSGLLGSSYLVFLAGWWLPAGLPLIGLVGSAIAYIGLHNQKLQQLAYVDGLTQIANRRYFDQQFAKQVQTPGHLSLLLCDVDCFKLYNDTYGHHAGDACLQKVATAIRQAVRRTDLVVRYGGEEFAVVLPGVDAIAAAKTADRILHQVRSLQLTHEKSIAANYVTLSCGVVSVQVSAQLLQWEHWSVGLLINQADQALYSSKQAGRDRCTLVQLSLHELLQSQRY
ncbi:CHASE2 domain-containing protein [Pantanalinema rosaneae CENA516]|uniref:CHASE2 domain-containing protein n=1 Tax=Pantanalinema rosaneae TaxID=1620701 RepID=UPI003D6FF4F4